MSSSLFRSNRSNCIYIDQDKNHISLPIHVSIILLSLILHFSYPISAATLPSGFTESQVVSGLSNPTAIAIAPDNRIFVCLQGGQLHVIKNGSLLSTPFVSLNVDSSGERGLLGIAFDPNFTTNQYIYLYYTVPATSTSAPYNRVSRFTANGDIAAQGSETLILRLNDLSSATNHNGGAMHFGIDGKLYIAVGENARTSNSQTLNNLLGKILRINPDGSIPTDNPFYNSASGQNRTIWALGLRNPYTFAIQPNTGRIFINDVGQSTWEEINEGVAGANYGWPTCEGSCSSADFANPIYQYQNDSSTCAITGGTFYNPQTAQFPSEYVGKYLFADFCGGWIRRFDPATGNVSNFASNISLPVDMQVGSDGSLYYLARGSGAIFRVQYTASQAPQISTQPTNRTVSVGQTATFTVSATGTAPLSYRWQRNGVNISGATSSSYTTPPTTTADNGAQYRVIVSNSAGSVTSNSATLTVVSNRAPTATITSPAEGTLYSGGQTINYAGDGTDPEDGMLPASAFTWKVDFHHDDHSHPFIASRTGSKTGSFVIPTTGETSANVWYRIYLTVVDSGGLSNTVYSDILPRKSTITLQTNPSGLQVTLDGQPVTTPTSVASVVGVVRTLGVVSPQTLNGQSYVFSSWSDGGAATHDIATPATNTTYTATFTANSNLLTNPGFEADGQITNTITGWSNWSSNNLVTHGTWTPEAHGGNYFAYHWQSVSYSAWTYQRRTGLTNGLYTLRAWVRSSGGQQEAQMGAVLDGGRVWRYMNIPIGWTWRQITLRNISVTDGTAEVGFWSVAGPNQEIDFDDVEFFKQ
jgi:glucose/arabinose dehydrogenase